MPVCRGVEVEGVADASDSTSDISLRSIDCDREWWNLSSVKVSLPMSLKGDSDLESSIIVMRTFEKSQTAIEVKSK